MPIRSTRFRPCCTTRCSTRSSATSSASWPRRPTLSVWKKLVARARAPRARGRCRLRRQVRRPHRILQVADRSAGACRHAHRSKVKIHYIDSEDIERDGTAAMLLGMDAILLPGGFGKRGTEGKIAAIRYARENKVPYLGICLGMQLAVIEFARHVAGHGRAPQHRVRPQGHAASGGRPDHRVAGQLGQGRKARRRFRPRRHHAPRRPALPGQGRHAGARSMGAEVNERHRHRYEVNNTCSSSKPPVWWFRRARRRPTCARWSNCRPDVHPWFVGCQFHPEFTSNPRRATRCSSPTSGGAGASQGLTCCRRKPLWCSCGKAAKS
jgi:CTP synthase (UTP-ammonia lyase)